VSTRHEPRDELLPERSGGTCNQDLHGFLLSSCLLTKTREKASV
jgi:hypothetical protein